MFYLKDRREEISLIEILEIILIFKDIEVMCRILIFLKLDKL